MKNIRILTHSDLDGAAFPHIIKKIANIYGNNYNVSIDYCDVNTCNKKIVEDFNKLNSLNPEALKNTFYIISDISNIGNSELMIPKIRAIENKGLNILCIDHHESETNEKMDKTMKNMYYSKDKSMSASMMGFVSMLNSFAPTNTLSELGKMSCEETKKTFKTNIESNLSIDKRKLEFQNSFFRKMFPSSSINNGKIREVLLDSAKFIRMTDYKDRRKVKEIEGLDLLVEFLDYSLEHTKVDLSKILEIMKEASNIDVSQDELKNGEFASIQWQKIHNFTKEIKTKKNPKRRLLESIKNTNFIRLNSGSKKIDVAICFGEGDLRFDLEDYRTKIDELLKIKQIDEVTRKKLDLKPEFFITVSRTSIGKKPILTIKPIDLVHGDASSFVKEYFKDQSIMGVKQGVLLEIPEDIYNKAAKARTCFIDKKDVVGDCILPELSKRKLFKHPFEKLDAYLVKNVASTLKTIGRDL